MTERSIVIFINPPNTGTIPDDLSAENVTTGVQHTDWANFPHLGILSLASYVKKNSPFQSVYMDGVVCPVADIAEFISKNQKQIHAVCMSMITANYGSGIKLCEYAKNLDSEIITIVGNDHFSALTDEVMSKSPMIDYGFVGNEIFDPFCRFLKDVRAQPNLNPSLYSGLVCRKNDEIVHVPVSTEAIFTDIQYDLLDRFYNHTDVYTENFQKRLGKRLHQLLGREIKRGIPIEFARGCIKFSGDDACSFCSIQYGGMWRNQVNGASLAWNMIGDAYKAGYDYLYVTADELPLTFPKLLLQMAENRPDWHLALPVNEQPVLVGYARADGLQKENVVAAMREVGFRICYVGIDAGAPLSLIAMNKPLRSKDPKHQAEYMFAANQKAAMNAKQHGIALKLGFVLGHIGMTRDLLEENVRSVCSLLDTSSDSVVSIDVELLSPEPGSKDFYHMINPQKALAFAEAHDLKLSSERRLNHFARKYTARDIFERDEAIKDYIKAFMPELTFKELSQARTRIRQHAKLRGVVIGDVL